MCDEARSHNNAIAKIKARNFYTPPVNEPRFINPFLLKSDTEAINEILTHLLEGEALEGEEVASESSGGEVLGGASEPTEPTEEGEGLNPVGAKPVGASATGVNEAGGNEATTDDNATKTPSGDPTTGVDSSGANNSPDDDATNPLAFDPSATTGQNFDSTGGITEDPLDRTDTNYNENLAGLTQSGDRPVTGLTPTEQPSGQTLPDDPAEFFYPYYQDTPYTGTAGDNLIPADPDNKPNERTGEPGDIGDAPVNPAIPPVPTPPAGVDAGGANASPDDPSSVADFPDAPPADVDETDLTESISGNTTFTSADGSTRQVNMDLNDPHGLEQTAGKLQPNEQFTYQGIRYSKNANGGTAISASNYNPSDVNSSILVQDSAGNYKFPRISSIREWTTDNPAFDENGLPATKITLSSDGSRYSIYYGGNTTPTKYIDRPVDGQAGTNNVKTFSRTPVIGAGEAHPEPARPETHTQDVPSEESAGEDNAWMVRADGSKEKLILGGSSVREGRISSATRDLNRGDQFTMDGVKYSKNNAGTQIVESTSGILDQYGRIPPIYDLDTEERDPNLYTWTYKGETLPLTKIEKEPTKTTYFYGPNMEWGNIIYAHGHQPSGQDPSLTQQIEDGVRKADDILSGGQTNFSGGGSGFSANRYNQGSPEDQFLNYMYPP